MGKNKITVEEREKVNKVMYDKLVRRQNLILSIYPGESQMPNTIQQELFTIISLKNYLRMGISSHIQGELLTDEGVYIDEFHRTVWIEDYKKYTDLKKSNEKYISPEQEESFVMPTYDVSWLFEDISNTPLSQSIEYTVSEIRSISQLCLYDDKKRIDSQLKDVRNERAAKWDSAKEKASSDDAARKEAYEAAKDRYHRLSLFGKFVAGITGKGLSSLNGMTTSELDKMYRGKRK